MHVYMYIHILEFRNQHACACMYILNVCTCVCVSTSTYIYIYTDALVESTGPCRTRFLEHALLRDTLLALAAPLFCPGSREKEAVAPFPFPLEQSGSDRLT